jgi:chromosomal replication initiation ATPase DnaA
MNPYSAVGTSPRISMPEIESCVLEYFGIEREVMYRNSRIIKSQRPRKFFCFIARQQKHTLRKIAMKIDYDHATVVNNTLKIANELDVMPDTRKIIEAMADRLGIERSDLLNYKPLKIRK